MWQDRSALSPSRLLVPKCLGTEACVSRRLSGSSSSAVCGAVSPVVCLRRVYAKTHCYSPILLL